jgi:dipeptidyl aminopeptidase/acylaminoacyl peptidase
VNSTVMLAVLFFFAGAAVFGVSANAEPYRLPPQEIVDIIDAAPAPSIEISPDGTWMLQVEQDALPSIADVARRMLRLAGMRIDPVANARFRTTFGKSLALRRRDSADLTAVPLPSNAKLVSTSWAHDSRSFAYSVVTDQGTELWVASIDKPDQPRRLTDRLLTTLEGFQWMPDAKAIVCVLVPEIRGKEPPAPAVPSGPNVQETSGNESPTRTYQDLLASPYDEMLFEYYGRGQLALLGADGQQDLLGSPAMIWSVETAPSGEHLLVTTLQRPYSYLLTARSFPQTIDVWNRDGKLIHRVADVPLAENIPIEGVRTGPRSVSWRTGLPNTLLWIEALDGGDPRVEVPHRDRFVQHAAPFESEPEELLRVEHRSWSHAALADTSRIITYEYDRDRRWVRGLLHDLKTPSAPPKVLMDRSIRDRYGDPGRLITVPDETGHSVVLQHGTSVYRAGNGASPEGNLPFLDVQNIETLDKERIWRCEQGNYESAVMVLDGSEDGPVAFVTQRQTPTEPPNYFLRRDDAKPQPLTHFPDPTPQIRNIQKQLIKYQRSDGVPLSATLYLPTDYKEGTRVPLLVWAYPIEFNDADTAGQVTSSPWRFTTIRGSSHLALLTKGYAILDAATMPVVGHPETMNDTFIEQLVASAKAAIDKTVEMGVADPDRVAVGGHSYGAFMTANLLAHCELFSAGIARSGAYNRTLTPFGFQSERRPLWEAREIYFNISPFMHADTIRQPLLMIHGEEDNNSGTFPMQSRRLFQAIKGNGGTARLVMLPEESHGYRARASVMQVQAEMLDWLEEHLKKRAPSE